MYNIMRRSIEKAVGLIRMLGVNGIISNDVLSLISKTPACWVKVQCI